MTQTSLIGRLRLPPKMRRAEFDSKTKSFPFRGLVEVEVLVSVDHILAKPQQVQTTPSVPSEVTSNELSSHGHCTAH